MAKAEWSKSIILILVGIILANLLSPNTAVQAFIFQHITPVLGGIMGLVMLYALLVILLIWYWRLVKLEHKNKTSTEAKLDAIIKNLGISREEEEYSALISRLRSQLRDLLSSVALTVHDVRFEEPPQFNVEGVYVISTPDDGEIIYTGKTRTKTVIERIADHRSIDTKSDLKGMLKMFLDYPQEIDEYLVRCVEISDSRDRTFFEHFSISVLQPPFNK